MKIRIPQFNRRQDLEPAQTNKKTINHTGLVVLSGSPLGRLDHGRRDERAIGIGEVAFLNVTGDNLLNLVLQPERNLGNLLGRLRWLRLIDGVRGEHCDLVSCVIGDFQGGVYFLMTYGDGTRPGRDGACGEGRW